MSFPASTLSGPADAELAQTVQGLALRAFLTSAEDEGYPVVGWRIASSSTDRVDYLAPGNDGWWFVSVEDIPDEGGWQAWEYGGCDPQVELPGGFGFASWVLDPANLPAADATSLTILATELACASGRPMAGRLTTPIVVETPDAVTIAVVVRTRPGGAGLPGQSIRAGVDPAGAAARRSRLVRRQRVPGRAPPVTTGNVRQTAATHRSKRDATPGSLSARRTATIRVTWT